MTQRTSDRVVGLDIGGANLKAVHSDGTAVLRPFALWKQPERLAGTLIELFECLPAFDRLAVTMTGELCDCFETKRAGVLAILQATQTAAATKPVHVWTTDGRFVDLATTFNDPLPAAAANWLALATFVGRWAPTGSALLIDVGSTTTDIIPLVDGVPRPRGRTDPERLRSGELLYTGVKRTPVCGLLGSAGAAEFFATMHDVYLIRGEVAADPLDHDTADGRPATREYALARLARMLCGDLETIPSAELESLADRLAANQCEIMKHPIRRVVKTVTEPLRMLIIAGSGEFLARRVLRFLPEIGTVELISLALQLGESVSSAACAYGVAQLAAENGGICRSS